MCEIRLLDVAYFESFSKRTKIYICTGTYEYEWDRPALCFSSSLFNIRMTLKINWIICCCCCCFRRSGVSFVSLILLALSFTSVSTVPSLLALVCLLVFWCVSRPVPLIFVTHSYAALQFNEMLLIKRWLIKPAFFSVSLQTEQFVHALKDELVKSALLALHAARPGYVSKSQSSAPSSPAGPRPGAAEEPHGVCNNVDGSKTPQKESKVSPVRSDSIPHHKEYDEEEWASAFTSRYWVFSPICWCLSTHFGAKPTVLGRVTFKSNALQYSITL